MGTPSKTMAERCRAIMEADRRGWQKASDIADELDAAIEAMQQIIDNHEQLRSGLDNKESAMEETGEDRSASLEAAWDEVVGALDEIASALDELDGQGVL